MKENQREGIDFLNHFELHKYKNKNFKEKLNHFESIKDSIIRLAPDEKIILVFENMIENFILLYSLNPTQTHLNYIKFLFDQTREYYKGFVKPYFDKTALNDIEKDKIKKLEKFMEEMEIDLD